jgi:carboxylesterase type B
VLAKESGGLFHRAIIQSNPITLPFKEEKDGEDLGKRYVEGAGCSEGDLTCLRNVSVATLLASQHDAQKKFNPLKPLDVFLPWTPMVGVGADSLPEQPFYMFQNDQITNRVPLITGVVANETMIFVYQGLGAAPSEALYFAFLVDVFGIHSAKVLEQYPPHQNGRTILHSLSLLGTDYIMQCPARAVAKAANAYLYYFDHVMSFSKEAWGPTYPECFNLTCHGEELVYLFGSLNLALPQIVLSPSVLEMQSKLESSWINFANGMPPQPDWKPYNSTTLSSYLFSTPESLAASGPIPFPHKQKCDFFDSIGYGESTRNAFVRAMKKYDLSILKGVRTIANK